MLRRAAAMRDAFVEALVALDPHDAAALIRRNGTDPEIAERLLKHKGGELSDDEENDEHLQEYPG